MATIMIAVTAPSSDIAGQVTSTQFAVDWFWYFNDGQTYGGQDGFQINWPTLITATTMNDAIRTAVEADILQQVGYTVGLLDTVIMMGAFVGL